MTEEILDKLILIKQYELLAVLNNIEKQVEKNNKK